MTKKGGTQGGVWMISQNRPQGWSIKKTRFHGPNVMNCGVLFGKRTLIVGAYLPPDTLEDLTEMTAALTHFQDKKIHIIGGNQRC